MEEEDFAKTWVIRGFEEVTLNYENEEMEVIGIRKCDDSQVFY